MFLYDFREKLRKAVKAKDTYGLVMDRVKHNAQKPQQQALTNGVAENQPLAITGLCFIFFSLNLV